MAPARDVVLIRHGETEWSASRKHTGTTDIELTDAGRRQAERLAPVLAQWQFTVVLASPLQRARETSRIAGLDCDIDPDLREWDYGDYEGRTTAEIRDERPGWTVWQGSIPKGEQIDDVAERADQVIARIARHEGDVALVSHGHFLRILAARWLDQPPQHGQRLMLDTGTLSVLSTEHDTRAVRLWNGLPSTGPAPTSPPST